MVTWLAWCISPPSPHALPASLCDKARYCVVTAFDLCYTVTPGRHFWVATLCHEQPEIHGPIYFGPKPPSDLPTLCEVCAVRLEESRK